MKHIQDIQSVQNLRTLRGERKGSLPKQKRSQFLELYVYEQERERLQQEIKILEKKILLNQKKLEKTIEHINVIRHAVNTAESEESNQKPKTVPLVVPALKVGKNRNTMKRYRVK